MRRAGALLAAVLLLVIAGARDGADRAPEFETVRLPSGREFIVHVPEGYRPDRPLPIVMGVHGYKGTDVDMYRGSELYRADAVTVFVLGVGDAWSPAPYASTTVDEDLAYVDQTLEWVRGHFAVTDEAFAAGLSNGGGFVHVLSCRRADVFDGFAAVAGANYDAVDDGCTTEPASYLDIHGTADALLHYGGGIRYEHHYRGIDEVMAEVARRNGCTTTPRRDYSATLVHTVWQGCAVPTENYKLLGGIHNWPGNGGDATGLVPRYWATDTVLSFFGVGQVT